MVTWIPPGNPMIFAYWWTLECGAKYPRETQVFKGNEKENCWLGYREKECEHERLSQTPWYWGPVWLSFGADDRGRKKGTEFMWPGCKALLLGVCSFIYLTPVGTWLLVLPLSLTVGFCLHVHCVFHVCTEQSKDDLTLSLEFHFTVNV